MISGGAVRKIDKELWHQNGDECSISLCFLLCASLFSLNSWYDILQVPINLGSRVSVLFCEIYQV
jgi:hypothetical protein